MNKTIKAAAAIVAPVAACALAGPLGAQNLGETGRYGTIALSGNFRPDPHTVNVQAGGPDDASALGSACRGFISNERPDYELTFSSPSQYALGMFVLGGVDTTLVVNDPSGGWWCNDDFGSRGGHNPGIVFNAPSAGTYDIWIGAYDREDTGENVQLVITEAGTPWAPLYGTAELSANFSPDPYTAEIKAGGADAAESLAQGCSGYVNAARPDYGIEYSNAGSFTLGVFAEGITDATLVVQDPAGRWFCNDDFSDASGRNPGVIVGDPTDGFYSVWVGTYSQADLGQLVKLLVTERGSPWSGTPSVSGGNGGIASSGTGFLVSPEGHVLTNHHVVDGCSRLTFEIRGNVAVDADVLSVNEAVDLALLKTSVAREPLPFRGGSSIRLGDEVVVFGFPLLGDLSSQGNLTYGIVSALSGLNDDLSRMQMTAQIQPGNSGGPVMDRYGNVVGVVVETANDEYFRRERGSIPQNVNFAIRDSLARSFLETNNVAYRSAPQGDAQLAIADIAEGAQRSTGLISCYQ